MATGSSRAASALTFDCYGTLIDWESGILAAVRPVLDAHGRELDDTSVPFPDTVEALRALETRYRLGVVSNVDDDLFATTAAGLEVPFDWVVTAQQVGAYKRSPRMFEAAIERLALPREAILHVAQSAYHDVAPARALGLATVLVRRRGLGATPASPAVPDLAVPDLASLVWALGLD